MSFDVIDSISNFLRLGGATEAPAVADGVSGSQPSLAPSDPATGVRLIQISDIPKPKSFIETFFSGEGGITTLWHGLISLVVGGLGSLAGPWVGGGLLVATFVGLSITRFQDWKAEQREYKDAVEQAKIERARQADAAVVRAYKSAGRAAAAAKHAVAERDRATDARERAEEELLKIKGFRTTAETDSARAKAARESAEQDAEDAGAALLEAQAANRGIAEAISELEVSIAAIRTEYIETVGERREELALLLSTAEGIAAATVLYSKQAEADAAAIAAILRKAEQYEQALDGSAEGRGAGRIEMTEN